MESLLGNPTFTAYALACLVLCVNLLFLWAYSGGVRARTGGAVNEEDAIRFKTRLVDHDPPEVARVLRAHANAQATIVPFMLVGLLYVLAGGGPTLAWVLFGVFTAARIAHSVVYLAGKQPLRTITFVIAGVALVTLMGKVAWLVIQGPTH